MYSNPAKNVEGPEIQRVECNPRDVQGDLYADRCGNLQVFDVMEVPMANQTEISMNSINTWRPVLCLQEQYCCNVPKISLALDEPGAGSGQYRRC
jgi:hypothetical protein